MNLEKLAKYACIVFVLLFISTVVFALEDNPVDLLINGNLNQNVTVDYGTLINVTGVSLAGDVNLYKDGEEVTNGEEVLLGVGQYSYKANTTGNDSYVASESGTYFVTINKAVPSLNLWIDGEEKDKTVDANWTINLTAKTNDNVDVTIEMNCSSWSVTDTNVSYNLVDLTCGEVVYNVTAYVIENSNYTSSSVTYFITSSETAPVLLSRNETPESVVEYSPVAFYNFNLTVQDGSLNNSIFTFDETEYDLTSNYDEIDNNTRRYHITLTDLNASNYVYSWFVNDSSGQSYSTGNLTYTVVKSSDLHLSINGNEVSDNIEVTTPNHVTVVCWAETLTTDKFTLQAPTLPSDKFTQTSNDTSYTRNGSTEGMLGEYNYLCYITDAALVPNYNNVSRKLTVVSPPSTGPGTSPPASGTLYFSGFKDLKVKAGTTGSLSFLLKNTFTTDKTDVQLLLSGNSEDPANPVKEGWCSLDAEKVTVPKSGSKTIKLTCKVPRAAVLGNYSLYIKAIKGSSSYPSSAKLIVEEAPPPTTTTEEEPEEEIEEEAEEVVEVLGEAELEEETPTGFILSPDILPDAILVIGFLSSGLIFLFRENVTRTFKKLGGREEIVPQKKIIKPKTSWIDRIKRTYEKYNYTLDVDFRKKYQTEFFDEEDENT